MTNWYYYPEENIASSRVPVGTRYALVYHFPTGTISAQYQMRFGWTAMCVATNWEMA